MKLSTSGLLNRSLTEKQLSWVTRFLFGISLLLIIALSYSYNTINKELIYFSQKVGQTQAVISALHDVSTGIYKTTYLTSSHLFLKDTAYGNKTLAAMTGLQIKSQILDSLCGENNARRSRMSSFKTHLDKYLEYNLWLFTIPESLRYLKLTPSLIRKENAEIDSMLKLVSEMNGMEQKLLHTRIQSRDNYMQQIFRYNWVIMLVAIVFLSSSFVLLDREIRRNKLYRVDLENKIENLNRSNSELEQFAYVASHDLQEPLRKIRSFSDRIILKYRDDLSDDVFQMLGKIDGSSQRMQALINDLLSYSRIVNTGTTARIVNLNQTLVDAKSNLSEMISENKALIHNEPLPSVEAYGTQMVQLFQNLLSNAIKYRQEEQRPVIRISHRLVDGGIIPGIKPAHQDIQFHQIRFTDNGIGFKKEFAQKIFVIFQRLHDRNHFAGTGIGLAICKRVVSNHNGYIFAESIEGEGSNFYIYLPSQSLLT